LVARRKATFQEFHSRVVGWMLPLTLRLSAVSEIAKADTIDMRRLRFRRTTIRDGVTPPDFILVVLPQTSFSTQP